LGVINKEFTNLFINSYFSDTLQRKKLLELFEKLEYQRVHDSPTLKHYTDWSMYDSLNLIPKIGNKVNFELRNFNDFRNIIIVNNNIINYDSIDSCSNKLINPNEHKLVALTLALSKKIIINTPGNYIIYHLTTDSELFSPINIEVDVNEGILNLVYVSELRNSTSLNSSVISIHSDKQANVNFTTFSLGGNGYSFSYIKAIVKGNINTNIFASGGNMSHIEYSTELYEGATAKFLTRGLGLGNDRLTIISKVLHKEGKSSSIGRMKGIAAMSSRVVLKGTATVSEEAKDSSTEITGKSLILGKDSSAIVVPMLEVKTGRVNLAKHSASVYKVLEDHIFYLQTRGLSKREAEGLVIREFLYNNDDLQIIRDYIDSVLRNLGY